MKSGKRLLYCNKKAAASSNTYHANLYRTFSRLQCSDRNEEVHSLNVRNKLDPIDSIKCRRWKRTERNDSKDEKGDAGYWIHEGG